MTVKTLEISERRIEENEPVTSVTRAPIRYVANEPSDPTQLQRMRLIETSGVLDFWDRPEEEIYTLEDGDPA